MSQLIEIDTSKLDEPFPEIKVADIQSIEIEDPVFLEKYTAHITHCGSRWYGWIPQFEELKHLKFQSESKEALIEKLIEQLHETLEARAQAWDEQIEEDIEAGRLDALREQALEDIHAGRFTEI